MKKVSLLSKYLLLFFLFISCFIAGFYLYVRYIQEQRVYQSNSNTPTSLIQSTPITRLKSKNVSIPFKGMNVTTYMPEIGKNGGRGFVKEEAEKSLENLRNDGVTHVVIVCRGSQDSPTSVSISPDVHALSDANLKTLIHMTQQAGIVPILKLHLFIQGDDAPRFLIGSTWIKKPKIEKEWFESYKRFLFRYVDISQEEHLPYLVIATELPSITIDTPETGNRRESEWRDLIGQVKQRSHNELQLIYAANATSVTKIHWFDALDIIGIDAYFTLSDLSIPSYDQIMQGWSHNTTKRTKEMFNSPTDSVDIVSELEKISVKYNRPIVFTEVGYRSADEAASKIVYYNGAFWKKQPINEKLQANLYKALFETFNSKTWFKGYFMWGWYLGNINTTATLYQRTHTPQKKLAEQIMKEYYSN